jgi:two-component system, LytTR family, response regulator
MIPIERLRVLRILIVDDEPIARQVLHDELNAIGDVAIVGEAESGKAALELIQRLTPDLVLLDLQMPELGGIHVLRTVSARNSSAIIAVSACENCSRIAVGAGAAGYLLKPVSPSSLREAIDRFRNPSADRDIATPESTACDFEFPLRSEICPWSHN